MMQPGQQTSLRPFVNYFAASFAISAYSHSFKPPINIPPVFQYLHFYCCLCILQLKVYVQIPDNSSYQVLACSKSIDTLFKICNECQTQRILSIINKKSY